MGLLSKIKSVFGFKTASETPQSHPRRNDKNNGNKPRRKRPSGANGGQRPHAARQQSQDARGDARPFDRNAPRRQRRPGDSKPRSGANAVRSERGVPSAENGEPVVTSRHAAPRPPRKERREPYFESLAAERPGGAFTKEQLKAYAAAHAAWDSTSYVVPEAEGKKRFVDFDLPSEILHAVADLGFQYCTPIQAQSLEYSLAGRHVAGRAQTGTGKTAAFLIAVLTRYLKTPEKRNLKPGTPRALILAPTRELVIQICKDAEALGRYCGDVRSLAVYGGMDYNRQRRELEDEPVDLLVATPGRLIDFVRHRIIDLRQVDTLVIDEADRMLDMGFIPDVRSIVNKLPDRDHRCTMLYSATLNETVMNLAAMWMRDPVRVEIEAESLATDTVRQIVYIARSEEKFTLLYNHLVKHEGARTIIFCNRKFTTERVSEGLRRRGIPCEVLSGDVNQAKRLHILEAFRAGKVRIVVATDVAGRGIHVDDIAFVVNYDFPYEPEDYVHRIGRTGRAGNTGTAISFADENESFTIPDIEAYINEPLKCIMPEEWMFAEPPPMMPRNARKRSDRKRKEETDASVAEDAPAAPAEATVSEAAAEVTPTETSEGVPAETTPETEKVSQPETAVTSAPETPSQGATEAAEDATVKEKPNAKARKNVRPEREPRFKPHGNGMKPPRKDSATARVPRKEKPIAKRFARTQADGPRDGSESHHAAPITARPIYAPGRPGPVTDEWTPGQ